MTDIDITQAFIIAGIILVLFLLFRDTENTRSQTTVSDDNKTREPYAPNIDRDFNQFAPVDDPYYYYMTPSVGWLSRRGLLPWWNSTRDTKNMSYDIRGDIPPFRYPVGPWFNSAIVDRPFTYREIY
jgi:hypothetical protein